MKITTAPTMDSELLTNVQISTDGGSWLVGVVELVELELFENMFVKCSLLSVFSLPYKT